MPVLQNFELASRSVKNDSYEARRKSQLLNGILDIVNTRRAPLPARGGANCILVVHP